MKFKTTIPMQELTKAEEQIMHYLWELKEAFVKDVVEKFPDPKPAYNTVSTIIRILEKKEMVGHTSHGKSFSYHPLISKTEYTRFALKNIVQGYFGGSYKKAVSFFVEDEKMSVNEIQNLLNQIKEDEE